MIVVRRAKRWAAPKAIAAWSINHGESIRYWLTVNWCLGLPTVVAYRECEGSWGAVICFGLFAVNIHHA